MLFDCGHHLRTPFRLQSIDLLLETGDAVVHEGDQPTHVMDSIKQRHLDMLVLHKATIVKTESKVVMRLEVAWRVDRQSKRG
ncbi:hypothetical protein B296_00023269 [Ensete ventricosum]|uniref:Uncharacterized protein n=1 Tax=Ensete ventricosum TaxID=4639 RepID=A0A426ZMY4_ENSVE|nr:hypothetical protein B296_00023269 [Ensete ventricosum]